jgi:hypothetical protein
MRVINICKVGIQEIRAVINIVIIYKKEQKVLVFETGSRHVAQADLKLMILLPQPPKCWDYRRVLLYLL